ncbi:MAG: hypothetical protein HN742_05775 [Lentisphaerae bacterium]|jgi:photosystem II stability/assembly factor-like uncharacterized protein|nr:hypothetical protein [Lentisphaerota bacterium]MBT7056121.1 hypothetical protein [Lentisphaerota bacterium]MBT7841359.1 hypothetical protein [Lentisphaerota bacterium]
MHPSSTPPRCERLQRRHGVAFVDFLRTHYWASFNVLPNVAEKCGVTLDELAQLMAAEGWELQKPPSLARQNRPATDLPLLDAVSNPDGCLDTFIRDFDGTPAAHAAHVSCHIESDRIRLRIACCEDRVADVSFAPSEPTDPDAELLWSGDTEALKDSVAWREGQDRFLKWAQEVGDRERSIFTDDCVVVTLCAVAAGDCPAYLSPVRFVRDPLPLLADPPSRHAEPRVYLEGSYYYVAMAPSGEIVSAFYDPWDGGVFWPCWKSGAVADVSRTDDGWVVDATVPLTNLEPLPVCDSVWGLDVFRYRPPRGGAMSEWTRAAESTFFRQTDNDLGEGRFLSTPEEFDVPGPRHAYIASELPSVDRVVLRDVSSLDVRPVPGETTGLGDAVWADAETISDLWLDQTGGEPQHKTDVRIAYDAQFLYVRFDCHDDDIANLRVLTRDEELAKYGADNRRANYLDRREAFGLDWGDHVEAIVAPGLEGTDVYHGGYCHVLVNSRGDVLTRYHDPYGACALYEGDCWRPALNVRVAIRDDRWEARLAIPLRSLHGLDHATNMWRCNLKRARGARDTSSPDCVGSEISAWSPEYGRCRLLERLGFLRFDGPLPRAETSGRVIVPGETDEGVERGTSPTAAADTLTGLDFPTPDKGWAVGGLGTIRHTDDGGVTWRTQPADIDYALEKVFFLDEWRGFAVGGRPRSQRVAVTGTAGVILVTSDGGQNWRTVFRDGAAHLFGLSFASDSVGYAVGGYGVVLKTNDSGESWQHLANTGTDSWFTSVHFVDDNHGWAAGEEGVVVATSDGGRTWERRDAQTQDAPFGLRAAIQAVHFLNPRVGWIAGDRGTFMRTGDGGRSWQPVDLGVSDAAADVMHFRAVRFVDERTGTVAGEPGSVVFRTEDGGNTWQREPGPFCTGLRDICFDRQGRAWAAGEFGAIARRVEAGWEQVASGAVAPRVLYGTPHGHHVNSTCWVAMADDYDIAMAIGGRSVHLSGPYEGRTRANTTVGCLEAGMRTVRSMLDMPGGRRREPHRIHHLYQNWQGIEPAERRLAAIIRSIRPRIVIAEWPILQEGYWAADVGLFARALINAFDSAADPARFPELAELGLPPWRAERLYGCDSRVFGNVYRIGQRPDWTVSVKESDVVKALGTRVAEARYRGACTWTGLLDRARPRSPGPIGDCVYQSSFHLLRDTTTEG